MDAEATARKQKHVAEEYLSSLSDLQCNSKPLINMLTMLADENIDHASIIVKVVEQHIAKVSTELKLPILYLIDSIVKNVKKSYIALFGQCIVHIFCDVFEKVNEKIRERMYALRQTWNEVFPASKLYALDVSVKQMDKNWPITAVKQQPTAIHVNPNFLKSVPNSTITSDMEELLQAKTRELLELRKRKLELELEATKKHIEEQQKQLSKPTDGSVVPVVIDTTIDTDIIAPLDITPSTSTQQIPQILPATTGPTTLENPALLTGQTQMPMLSYSHVYSPNYSNSRQRIPPIQQQVGAMPIIAGQAHPNAIAQSNINKVKVHPVNPALLNSIRHRDPRLMRQQQQQQQQLQQQNQLNVAASKSNIGEQQQQQQQPSRSSPSTTTNVEETKRDRRENYKASKSSRGSSSSNSSSVMESNKSPTRHSSSSRSSSHRSSKSSSSSSSLREKERERKRNNDTKSYGGSSSDRRHPKASNNREKHTNVTRVEKDATDELSSATSTTTTSATNKQIKSPNGSPHKFKDGSSNKRSHNSNKTNNSRNGIGQRSNSPDDIVSSTKDVDLRPTPVQADSSEIDKHSASDLLNSTTTSAELIKKAAIKGLEQNIKQNLDSPLLLPLPPPSPPVTANPKQPIKSTVLPIADVDLRELLPPGAEMLIPPQQSTSFLKNLNPLDIDIDTTATLDRCAKNLGNTQTAPVLVASSSSTKSLPPKVSFKIQKLFNKLAKSTEPLSTATSTISTTTSTTTTTSSSSSSSSSATIKNNLEEHHLTMKGSNKMVVVDTVQPMDIDKNSIDNNNRNAIGDGKKRLSEQGANDDDQPIAKKSKSSTKMDALFGSEDVDLRTLGPSAILTKPLVTEVLTAPPPTNISTSDDDQNQEVTKNRDYNKNLKSSNQNSTSQKLPSNFEDVRAKFAKATRIEKIQKSEKITAEKVRQKLAEVNSNDDENTQEANDEKIRIILSQAQEMLESKSINSDQYKTLVQTVMSISEKNKLKEAKKRESLTKTTKDTSSSAATTTVDDDSGYTVDAELLAARDAVLRKRIPKLPKTTTKAATTKTINEHKRTQSPLGESDDAQDEMISEVNKLKPKEKRIRASKWSDRNENQNAGNAPTTTASGGASQQRNWSSGVVQKRGATAGQRGSAPPPPQAPQPPPGAIAQQRPMQSAWQGSGGKPFGNQMPLIRSSVPPPPQPPMNMPPVLPTLTAGGLPKPCNSIDNPQAELVRTITIDGQSKDIRIYDDVAIVFMEIDQPREIGFQPGHRAIIIDNQEPFTLHFNDNYKPVMIAGDMHRVRFGFPSRELYIDEHWYEIYFGGPPVSIPINNRIHILKAEGPPPQVNIGPLRLDLVVGKIQMIVEQVNVFPLFLDARIQTFRHEEIGHTVQFADNLLTVLLDGKPIHVEYGGLPKSYSLNGKRYFIRFTTLPKGITAGKVEIKDMIYVNTERPKKIEKPIISNSTEDVQHGDNAKTDTKTETPIVGKDIVAPPAAGTSAVSAIDFRNVNLDDLYRKLVSSGIIPNTKIVTAPPPLKKKDEDSLINELRAEVNSGVPPIHEIGLGEQDKEIATLEEIIPIDLSNPESIKTRQAGIIAELYSGMQCSSCGVRFPPEQTIKYSQHLDWHFRQNRRERDSTRKAHSRKWYYDINDWLQYEEIEDLDEREKNFFETQQNELEAIDDISNQRSTNSPVPSCAAGSEDVDRMCDICQEKFEQFYNEEQEEWHLRPAVRVGDKIYHPLCYEDYRASLNPPKFPKMGIFSKSESENVIMQEDDNAVDAVIKIEEDEKAIEDADKTHITVQEDDDDDVIVLPNEEPSVTEIVDDDDDEEYIPANVTREEMGLASTKSDKDKVNNNGDNGVDNNEEKGNESAMESDVEIQEPNIPFTDLDTYEEKELPAMDETSQASFLNVKIKEEPKDDEDEDDGFEDVGTVLYSTQDEISIQSSEETQTHTILSSVDSPITVGGDHSMSGNLSNPTQQPSSSSTTTTAAAANQTSITTLEDIAEESNNISMDGDLETADEQNLSIAGPAPAVSLGSLVNKIKINITKNTTTAAAAAAAAATATITAASISTDITTTIPSSNSSVNSLNSNTDSCNLNTTNTNVVSTIPVLCGGGTMSTSAPTNNNVSNITVIGSYGNYQHQQKHQQQQPPSSQQQQHSLSSTSGVSSTAATTGSSPNAVLSRQRTPTPPAPVPVEDTITYEQKPALKKATLKKMQKIQSGVETSGLCSIM